MSRINYEYVSSYGAPVAGRCSYASPPNEYARYHCLHHVNPNVTGYVLVYQSQVRILCGTAAQYGGGGQTFTMAGSCCDGFGVINGTAGARAFAAEFEYDTGGGITPPHIQIDITAAVTAADVAAATAAAIRATFGNGVLKTNYNLNIGSNDTCQVVGVGPKTYLTATNVSLPPEAGITVAPSKGCDVFPSLLGPGKGYIPYWMGEGGASSLAILRGQPAYYHPMFI